jgi:hypothetical protein
MLQPAQLLQLMPRQQLLLFRQPHVLWAWVQEVKVQMPWMMVLVL